jgi:hypothetical protein
MKFPDEKSFSEWIENQEGRDDKGILVPNGTCSAPGTVAWDRNWTIDGRPGGQAICKYSVHNGINYYRITWGSTSNLLLGIVLDPLAQNSYSWWQSNGASITSIAS